VTSVRICLALVALRSAGTLKKAKSEVQLSFASTRRKELLLNSQVLAWSEPAVLPAILRTTSSTSGRSPCKIARSLALTSAEYQR